MTNPTTDWINVNDRLPGKNEIVLSIRLNDISEHDAPYTPEEAMCIAFYSSGKWWEEAWPEAVKDDNIIHDVTHWRVLPEPPE